MNSKTVDKRENLLKMIEKYPSEQGENRLALAQPAQLSLFATADASVVSDIDSRLALRAANVERIEAIVEQIEQNATLAIAQEVKAAYDDCQAKGKQDGKTPYQQWLDWGAGIKRRDGQVGYKADMLEQLKSIAELRLPDHWSGKLPDSYRVLKTLTRELRSLPESAQQVIVGEIVEAQAESEKTLTSSQVKEIVEATKSELDAHYSRQLAELNTKLQILQAESVGKDNLTNEYKEQIQNLLDRIEIIGKERGEAQAKLEQQKANEEAARAKAQREAEEKFQAKLDALKEKLNEKDKTESELRTQIENLSGQLLVKNQDLNALNKKLDKVQSDYTDALKNPDPEAKKKVSELQKAVQELESKRGKLINEIGKIELDIEDNKSFYSASIEASLSLNRLTAGIEEAIKKNVDALKYLSAPKLARENVEKARYIANFFRTYAGLIEDSINTAEIKNITQEN